MTNFWRTHKITRLITVSTLFIFGIALVIYGWCLTGKLLGLGLMLLGVGMLLLALNIYNRQYVIVSR